MTKKDLLELLKDIPDDMEIYIPTSMEFEGQFYTPCQVDSGVQIMGMENMQEEEMFILVPCGFFDEEEDDHRHLLN